VVESTRDRSARDDIIIDKNFSTEAPPHA